MVCQQCGTDFTPRRRRKDVRFCSARCRTAWHPAHRRRLLGELAVALDRAAALVSELREGEERRDG